MNIVKEIASAAIAPVANIFVRKTERKIAKDTIEGQVALAKLDNQASVAIGVTDWERLSKAGEGDTWKDEYVTLSFIAPINILVFNSILAAMGWSDGSATAGVLNALDTLNNVVNVPVGDLITWTVGAALSIKLVKGVI